ncbi:MAG: hypothetical protein CVU09_08660 [Bacteroidetes bacterium HGW-Bacteroidetes-4]|jgi:hypothetical protein|nr:MAG: hypothetical protein CVU09_08660 [Bacteroidetes bacterium HGW-Bacteroidetes-4]
MVKKQFRIFTLRFLLFSLLFAAFQLSPNHSIAQCGMALKDVVVKEIGNATYLKDFRVRLEEGKNPNKPPAQEFSILLNKGTHYRFNIKADSTTTDQVILKLYDFQRFYGSNYDQSDGTSYEFFDFFCAKTQVYYLSISFATAQAGCAAAIVSFVENYDAN